MRTDFNSISDFMDSVEKTRDLSRLLNIHNFCDGEERNFNKILERHTNPRKIDVRFLWLNTFLMKVDLIGGIFNSDAIKPAVDERAFEIGQFIKRGFDIAALCEVWEQNALDKILAAWDNEHKPSVSSDITETSIEGSGLGTLGQIFSLVASDFCEYDADFDAWYDEFDEEHWAGKGVLLTVYDVGLGESKLEIFSTHTTAVYGEGEGPDDIPVRTAQLNELAAFVSAKHDPKNHTLIVGDFNVDQQSPEYIDLINLMNSLGFDDLWYKRNTFLLNNSYLPITPGYTSDIHLPSTAAFVCKPDPEDERYFDDFGMPFLRSDFPSGVLPSSRIDYIFVKRPSAEQSFTMDFTRPRRMNMKRDPAAAHFDQIQYMSDHVGLGVTMILSPKTIDDLSVIRNDDGRLEIFYTRTDNAIFHTSQLNANSGWGEKSFLGVKTNQAKSLCAGKNKDGRLELFYIGTDDRIYHNWQNVPNGNWAGEAFLGTDADMAKSIAVQKNKDGRLELFYIGTNDTLFHNWQNEPNGSWSGESLLLTDANQAKSFTIQKNKDGMLEIFYIGTNDMLYNSIQTAAGGWTTAATFVLPGRSIKEIQSAINADGRLEIFYLGTDNKIYHKWQIPLNGSWSQETLFLTSKRNIKNIHLSQNSDGRLEIFYTQTNNKIYHRYQTNDASGWSEVSALSNCMSKGGAFRSALNQDGRMEIFYPGVDGQLYHCWQSEPNGDWGHATLFA